MMASQEFKPVRVAHRVFDRRNPTAHKWEVSRGDELPRKIELIVFARDWASAHDFARELLGLRPGTPLNVCRHGSAEKMAKKREEMRARFGTPKKRI